MVDVAVRDQNPLDVRQLDRLIELRADGFQAREHLLVAMPVAAAGIDQRDRTGLEQQIDVGDEAGKGLASNAIDPHAGAGDESLDGGKFGHGLWRGDTGNELTRMQKTAETRFYQSRNIAATGRTSKTLLCDGLLLLCDGLPTVAHDAWRWSGDHATTGPTAGRKCDSGYSVRVPCALAAISVNESASSSSPR